jgi:hypothetical protein
MREHGRTHLLVAADRKTMDDHRVRSWLLGLGVLSLLAVTAVSVVFLAQQVVH